MKKIKMRCRRALALLLVFTMCMGTMAGTAFAAEDGTTDTAGTEAAADTADHGSTHRNDESVSVTEKVTETTTKNDNGTTTTEKKTETSWSNGGGDDVDTGEKDGPETPSGNDEGTTSGDNSGNVGTGEGNESQIPDGDGGNETPGEGNEGQTPDGDGGNETPGEGSESGTPSEGSESGNTPQIEGSEIKTETTTTDENGNVVEETEKTEGSETVTTTTPEVGEEITDDIYAGDVTVDLTPGEKDKTESQKVDMSQLVDKYVSLESTVPSEGATYKGVNVESVERVTDEAGKVIGYTAVGKDANGSTAKVIGELVKDEKGVVIGYTIKVVTTETNLKADTEAGPGGPATAPDEPTTEVTITLPERPEASGPVTDENGNTTSTAVEEIYDNGQVVGYTKTTVVVDASGLEISRESESVWGTKTITVKETTESQEIVTSSTTTLITTGTTASGVWVEATDRKVTASMGEGDFNSTVEPTEEAVKPDMSIVEGNLVKYDAKNDLYDREGIKKTLLEGVGGNDIIVWSKAGKGQKIGYLHIDQGHEVYVYEETADRKWARIGQNAWISTDWLQKYGTYTVATVTDPLNVRTTKVDGDVIGKLPKDTTILIDKVDRVGSSGKDYWYHIKCGELEGWVSGQYVNFVSGDRSPSYEKEGDSQYWYLGENGLESSIRVKVEDGKNTWMAHQYVLEDKEGNKYYTYCADLDTDAHAGYGYDLKDVEDADYYKDAAGDNKAAGHIRAIAANGYWGTSGDGLGSLEAMKKQLATLKKADGKTPLFTPDEIKDLTPGEALTATQAALWHFGNRGRDIDIENMDAWAQYYGYYYDKSDKKAQDRYNVLTDGQKMRVSEIYKWLIGLEPTENPKDQMVKEDDVKITDASITVKNQIKPDEKQTDGTVIGKSYNTNVTFTVTPSRINGDLIVQIKVGDKVIASQRVKTAGQQDNFEGSKQSIVDIGNGSYRVTFEDLPLEENTDITINLTGSHDLGPGVYIFTSETKNDVQSQTFVGITSTNETQKFDMNYNLSFAVTEATAKTVTAETNEVKREWQDFSKTVYADKKENNNGGNTPNPTPSNPSTPPTTRTRRDRSTPISDTPTPLAGIPDDPTPLAMLPEEQVPLAILDEDVPLASVPATGDISGLWYALTLFAGLGLMGMGALNGKKRKDA